MPRRGTLTPGTVVSARRKFLKPAEQAETLADDDQTVVKDLVVVGCWPFNGRGFYELKHSACPEPLFAGMVSVQQRAAVSVAPTGHSHDGLGTDVPDVPDQGDTVPEGPADHELADPDPTSGPTFIDWRSLQEGVHVALDRGERATHHAKFLPTQDKPRTPGDVFLSLLPPDALGRLQDATNANLDTPITDRRELLAFLAIMMRCADDVRPRAELWARNPHPLYPNPPLSDYMTQRRFDAIASAMTLSRSPDVRELVASFNEHMRHVFRPCDTVCLDESVVNHAPGSTCDVPKGVWKAGPASDKYFTVCDKQTRVVFRMELPEGKDRDEDNPPEYEQEFGKMGGLILRMAKPLFTTGSVLVLDSAFCIVKAIAELERKGVFAAAAVEKRRFWPKHLADTDAVVAAVAQAPIGELHARKGTTASGQAVGQFAVNYGKRVMQLFATYGSDVVGEESFKLRTSDRVISFRRNNVLKDYYSARFSVDQHNHLRQCQQWDLERAWAPRQWEVRQLAFVISITLVNGYLCTTHFHLGDAKSVNDFRRQVAVQLMEAWKTCQPGPKRSQRLHPQPSLGETSLAHELIKLNNYEGAVPGKRTKFKYQHVACKGKGCNKYCRTYCKCNRRLCLCLTCFHRHLAEAD